MNAFDDDGATAVALRQLRHHYNDTGVRFQITDLDLAHSFLDYADVARDWATIERNHRNAREAVASVEHFLKRLHPSKAQQAQIATKLTSLYARLRKVQNESHERSDRTMSADPRC